MLEKKEVNTLQLFSGVIRTSKHQKTMQGGAGSRTATTHVGVWVRSTESIRKTSHTNDIDKDTDGIKDQWKCGLQYSIT
ncbi:hypothetical protein E2C01_036889 [Portunus trituberculatus]|uniref:Uncharacterized protein n=1 Tax=Portunus trituberculatus TaxID=210409 RepID=A0A5B7FCG3_PORTR|nr:hypothetical protein [Portunus trituberculatus]